MNLFLIPQDKANHFVYGACITLVVGSILAYFSKPELIVYVGPLAALLIACMKELADKLSNSKAIAAGLTPTHGVELMDVVYTVLGGITPVVLQIVGG